MDSLEALYDRIRNDALYSVKLHETADAVALIDPTTGSPVEFKKDPPARTYEMLTLQSFTEYVKNNSKTPLPEIKISETRIKANFGIDTNVKHEITLPLTTPYELTALKSLDQPRAPKEILSIIRRHMSMDGCMDPKLVMSISTLSFHTNTSRDWKVDAIGIDNGEIKKGVSLKATINGQPVEMNTLSEWTFQGRIFECMDKTYPVNLVMMADTENGLKLSFTPIMLDRVITQARTDLVAFLKEELNGVANIYC